MGGPAGVELDADELAELCLEMGEWKPIEPLFGGGRASPAIVEMVFESLTVAPADESSTSGVNPYEGFQSTHRLPIVNGHAHGSEEPLSTDEDMDSDSASLDFCSYRCPVGILSVPPESSGSSHASLETQSEGNLALLTQLRKGQGSQPQRRHSAHCCPTSTEHGTDTGGAAHKPLRQSCSDPTTAKPRSYLQAIEEEASSSSSSESRPHRGIPVGRTSRDAHPFVRLPLLEPGADKDLPDLRALNLRGRSPLLAHSLKIVRSFLMKPILNKIEVIELLKCEATMLRQAAQLIALSVDNLNPSSAVEVLGRRFLVLQALHSVAKLLGDHVANNVWYKSVFALLPSSYSKRFRRSFGRWSERYIILSRDLIEAMEMYRVGDEPSAERIIDLKRRLLCLPDSPSGFRRVAWSIWRTDDMLFQGRS
ncbi:hypothetical protein, conserved [Eimeria tenella]|uniref:Uncharacterized protein n=1 Tax=Eimeria tenella TaxID=5802 RepID=U6KIK5_EIMTE|nr:hypothetical protein, conserved [Eimeria tenella]CDJ37774.1 hypothetical protein, conserved [Eimeria tenella]|eukprot:XP_013228612.1 hypothetical protein, conserved [Eimeria tenella]